MGWLIPAAGLAGLLGWEVEHGVSLNDPARGESTSVTPPLSLALLPEYRIEGGLAKHDQTVSRTLFNPTRRPAPSAQQGKPQVQRGQFILLGTTVTEDGSFAVLREIAGSRTRFVRKDDRINGMLVVDIKPDRVKLADGAYTEEVVFKAASSSRAGTPPTAIQPSVLSASVGQSIMPSAPPSGFPALGQQTQSTTEEDEAASSSH